MSTFGGKILDLPDFSIDRFDKANLQSTVFFLSHCHMDHMHGLNDVFELLVISQNYPIFMSPVSAGILRKMKPSLKNNIKELDPYSGEIIGNVSVKTIPAGHCPGSVMFLFIKNNKTILYTGDFRLSPNDLSKISAFYDNSSTLRVVDEVYLDTTFFLQEYKWFPKREESLHKICNLIEEWISRNNDNIAHIKTSANYGYEYLFNEIYKYFKKPVFISDPEIFDFYMLIPEMDYAVTNDATKTRISANRYPVLNNNKCKNIRVSAWAWRAKDLDEYGISDENRVCFSTHASYEECWAFVRFLKPKRVEPNVNFENQPKKRAELLNNIKKCITSYSNIEENDKDTCNRPAKLFKIDNTVAFVEENKADCCDFDLDSPPRRKM